jgi:hypothetical protein
LAREVDANASRASKAFACEAFSIDAMLDDASLVVWTKGQMRGVRACLKRLGLK